MKQIFKLQPDCDIIYKFLKNLADKYDNYYIINYHTFNRSKLNGNFKKLIDYLLPLYYKSKQFYLTRELKYTYFLTIIRQICKSCSILYNYKIKYLSSKYMIEYYFYEL